MEKIGQKHKLYMIGTGSIPQAEYDELAGHPDTKRLDDEDARELLQYLCGFVKERIRICHSVPVYETGRYGDLYKAGERDRRPLFQSARRNYILFDCGCASYELKNGSLRTCDIDIMEIQKD